MSTIARPTAHRDHARAVPAGTTRQPLGLSQLPSSEVAGLSFVDRPTDLVDAVAHAYARQRQRLVLLAAHVTALNTAHDPGFRRAFNGADAGYIDGISWVLLARLAGDQPHKLATTELAPAVMEALARELGRPARVAVLGGEPTSRIGVAVADAAADALAAELPVEIVYTTHGYHEDWPDVLAEVGERRPDVLVVGLGMPREAFWVAHFGELLPDSVVITCGGWLRLLAGLEHRAPRWMQVSNLEWLHRLVGDPRRTAQRYTQGFLTLGRYSVPAVGRRLRRGARP